MSSYIHTFSDGLRLVHTYSDTTRSVGVIVLCGVGSQNEDDSTNGISHFIEHNVFKGTTGSPWVGFDIFHKIFSNHNFWNSIRN